jgi:hypothetical protein
MAGQRVLLIRGLMDYIPGISPMTLLKARLANEGYDVTMITHLNDGLYKNQYWDAVIGHSQGAIDALRDAPDFARYNPHLTIIAVDPPRTSILFHCVRGVRYFDLHTGEFGLGGGSLSCPQAQNLAMGGLHITLPMRSDTQEQILAYLSQDTPIEMAYAEPTHVLLPRSKPKLSLQPIKPKPSAQAINPKPSKIEDETSFNERFNADIITLPMRSDTQEQILAYLSQDTPIEMAYAEPTHVLLPRSNPKPSPQAINPKPSKIEDEISFDERFNAAGATNVLVPPVIPWTERSYAGVLDPN